MIIFLYTFGYQEWPPIGRGAPVADQRAIAVGLAVIRLYTNVRMEKNIALYRRHGYAEAGTRPHPSRAGEVLVDMVRAVPPSAS